MVPRDFAPSEVINMIDIKGLATPKAFGGRFDAVYLDPG
jgi:hypothetical protein